MHPLDGETYIRIGTYRSDGSLVAVPVWAATCDDALYVFTEADSYKVRRLRRNPAVRASACTLRGKPSGPWFSGRARVLADGETDLLERAYARFHQKYGWQMWIADTLSKLSGRYENRAMLELTLDKEPLEGLD